MSDEMKALYFLMTEEYLKKKYGIDTVEERLKEHELGFVSANEDGSLFHVLNDAHYERIAPEEWERFEDAVDAQDNEALARFISESYPTVLYGNEDPDVSVEFFPDIHGRGISKSNTIFFNFEDIMAEDGNGIDIEKERQKDELFFSVKTQFEEIVNGKEPELVRIVRL